jgi:hypothetical protein
MVALPACSSGGTKPARGHGRPAGAHAPRPAATAAPPTTTTAPPTTTAPTTAPPPPLAVAPPGPLTVGQWRPIGLIVRGAPTLTATVVPGGPGTGLVGVVRINATVTRPVLYAGTAEPGGTWPNQGAVAGTALASLVGAFNSGFHTYASSGGWFDHGRTAVSLRPGAASLVIRADGSATVGMWGRDASLTPDVVSVRQNLGLLVDGGASLASTGSWGATFGHVRYTWRSGVGVDAAGNVLYAGGPGLDAQSLAQVLIQAGAVRAMELDINPQWVAFAYYTGPGSGSDLLPGMNYGPGRWLSGSTRDFIAIFTR